MLLKYPEHASHTLAALGIDSLTSNYIFDGADLSIPDITDTQIEQAEAGLDITALNIAVHNEGITSQISALEESIDTPRIRREYAEGVRKQVQGVSPTPDELWSVNKVQSVDNEIGVMRSQLK